MENREDKIQDLKILLNDLSFMQKHFFEIIEKLKLHCECEEETMKLLAIDFNNSVSDMSVYYKNILKLCIDLYWNNQSYISSPVYKEIDLD